MKVKTSSPVPLSVKVPSPNDPQIQCGLNKNTSAKVEKTEAKEFPAHLNAIVNAMVDGSVKFGGGSLCIVARGNDYFELSPWWPSEGRGQYYLSNKTFCY